MSKRHELLNKVGLKFKKRDATPVNIDKPIIRKKITAISKLDQTEPKKQGFLDIAVYDSLF